MHVARDPAFVRGGVALVDDHVIAKPTRERMERERSRDISRRR